MSSSKGKRARRSDDGEPGARATRRCRAPRVAGRSSAATGRGTDAAVAGGSVAREGYAPRGRYQRPTSEATVLHKSNGSTGFVRNASKPASLSSLLVYLSQRAVPARAGSLPPFDIANRRR